MMLLGNIDTATRTAVMNLGGHGHSTTQQHYVLQDRMNEATEVSRVFPVHHQVQVEGNDDLDEGEDDVVEPMVERSIINESSPLHDLDESNIIQQQHHVPQVLPAQYGYSTQWPSLLQCQSENFNQQSQPRQQPASTFQYRKFKRVVYDDWGVYHPQIEMVTRKRADWTDEEVGNVYTL